MLYEKRAAVVQRLEVATRTEDYIVELSKNFLTICSNYKILLQCNASLIISRSD